MKKLYIILLAIFSFGCNQRPPEPPEEINKENAISAVQANAANQIRNKFGLVPCGTGAEAMHDVKMLALSFLCYEPIDQEIGRALLFLSVDEFLKSINSNENIQPFLSNKPFLPKNVEITIYMRNPDNSDVAPNKLSVISAVNEILEYEINDPTTKRLITIHKETYEEAVAKIKTASFLSESPSPKQNETTEKSDPVTSVTQRAGKNISIKTGLIQCGGVAGKNKLIEMLALHFLSYEPIDLMKGRSLLISMANDFLKEINQDSEIKPLLSKHPLGIKDVRIMIGIKNPDNSNLDPGQICAMSVAKGMLEYQIRNPKTQKLETIYQETYEDAVAKL